MSSRRSWCSLAPEVRRQAVDANLELATGLRLAQADRVQESVSAAGLARLCDRSRHVTPKVSGRKFPFPELLSARSWRRANASGSSRQTLDRIEALTGPERSSYAGPQLEPERAALVWPGQRKIDETLETVAARQTSLDGGLDDDRGEESERQRRPDQTVCLPQNGDHPRGAGRIASTLAIGR